ncbi:zinc finger, PHD-type [Artemisia annua]|uniref:Zinc finger, PHD-type n=1 Tax=Artemisia annua TaxID=35608 RepID=A0A2U1M9R0_ARTAN|nr:zinc finger, PHD-type [Artemisia annua]
MWAGATHILEHEHPLNLIDLQPNYPLYEEKYDDDDDNGGGELITRQNFRRRPCDRCSKEITWFHRYYYECAYSCDYSLHKFCGELPITLKHTSHPAHTLNLIHLSHPLLDPRCFCVLCGRNDTVGLCYCCIVCRFQIHGNCTIASVEDRLIYHPSHRHPLAATLKPQLSECNACGKEHEGTFYICTTCFGLFIHSDCAFLPENLMIQNATNDIFSHPHPLILSYSFPIQDQKDQYFPKCRVCKSGFYDSANTWIYKCEKCRYYAHIPCAKSRGAINRLLIKNYKDSDYPDLLHLPFPDESYSIPKHMFAKLVEHGKFGADEGNYVKHNFHPHPLILVRTECNDITSIPTSSKTTVISCHNPMKKVQLLCNACVRPVTSVPFYKCVNDDCNFVLHEWCTQLPTQVEKYPGHPEHTFILHPNAPNKFLSSVFRCDVCQLECNGFVYSCVECYHYHIDVTCCFMPQNITHEAHSGHLLSRSFKREHLTSCLICKDSIYPFQRSFACDTCKDVVVHVGCALLLPREIRHKYDKKHPMRLSYLPIENHKSEYFCEICEKALNPEKCFYHCYECAWSIHTFCAPHILQSESSVSDRDVDGLKGPYMFVNIKFGGIYKFERRHPHPLSFVQGIESDGPCSNCGYAVKYHPILKCQKCKYVIHFVCCRWKWRNDEIVEEI